MYDHGDYNTLCEYDLLGKELRSVHRVSFAKVNSNMSYRDFYEKSESKKSVTKHIKIRQLLVLNLVRVSCNLIPCFALFSDAT